MANKTIGELTEAAALDGTELAHIVQGGNSRRVTAGALSALAAKSAEIAALLPRFVQGLELSNNATDATNDIDIASGAARGNGVAATNSGTMVKRLDAAWAEGTNQGGLDTGSKANSTTYHVHAIRKDSDGAFDALFSTSATAPTVPSGWTRVERLGAVLTDGSGAVRGFTQWGNDFVLSNMALDANTTSQSTAAIMYSLSVPSGISIKAHLRVTLFASSVRAFLASSPFESDQAPYHITGPSSISTEVANARPSGEVWVITDTSGRIRGRASGVLSNLYIHTIGWQDHSVPRI